MSFRRILLSWSEHQPYRAVRLVGDIKIIPKLPLSCESLPK